MAGRPLLGTLLGNRWARFVLVVLIAVQGVGLLPGPVSQATGTIAFGATPGSSGDNRIPALNELEGQLDRTLDFVRVFELWDSPFPTAFHDLLVDTDHKMLLSVRAKRQNGSYVSWRAIADSQPGTTIHDEMVAWVQRVGALGVPVWFTFNHEPEVLENFNNGTDQDFIDAWQRIVDEFAIQGVTNAEFVWIMTDHAFRVDDTDWRHAPKWYPGDAYVDLMGTDAYNYSDCRPLEPISWRPLEESVEDFRDFALAHPDKELILSEWASTEMPDDGGAAKAAWIDEAAQLFQQPGWEQFIAVGWFNTTDPGHPACDWDVASTPAALDAIKTMANDPFYGGTQPGQGGVLFVVGNPTALTPGEAAVVARLQASGSVVSAVDDDAVTAGAATGADLVIISSSSATLYLLANTFRWVSTPVWVSKPWLLDDYGMTGTSGGSDYGSTSASQVTITDPGHPLAAGLSGTVSVTSGARLTQFGIPGGDATTVATVAGKPTIFVYEAGEQMADGSVAPGCRMAFSIFQNAPTAFTTDGWTLFDTAAAYAIGGCGSAAPNTPPSVSITSPADGATVSGSVVVTADAVDSDGVDQVEFFADGASLGVDADEADGWSVSWDTSTATEGPALLSATATDSLGASASDAISVTVDHGAPSVSITSPADAALVSGTTVVVADASDPEGVAEVEFFVDSVSLGVDTDGSNGWSMSWDTNATPDGPAAVSATATDSLGASATHTVSVSVDNIGPTASITAPVDGATVSGTILVTATATDVVGVAQVEFFADGASLGVDTDGGDGWSASWDTSSSPDGSVAVSATATDLSGATDTDTISVTVDSSGGGVVVMVVGNSAALSSGEAAVVARFEGLGAAVSVEDDDTASAASAAGADLVVVSSSASTALVGTTFKSVSAPVWISKPWLLDDMAMTGPTGNTDYGIVSVSGATITNPGHPLAAGLDGTVAVTSDARLTQFGVPSGDGVTVATASGQPSIFIYEPGQLLADGSTATGCRLGFSIYQNAPTVFTPDGWALFDAAATYAMGGCVPVVPNDPPAVVITDPGDGATVAGVITVLADATDSDGVAQVEFLVDGLSLGIDADGSDGWSVSWDTTAAAEGQATVSAVATDSLGVSGSDAISVTVDNTSDLLMALVVGNPTSLSGGDTAVVSRLEGAGYVVTIVDDDAATAATANGLDLLIVSSTANSNVLGTTFKSVATPVWVSKPWLLDDMGMTGTASGSDYGSTSVSEVVITDPAHPLAAGLSGTVTVTTKPRSTQFGIPGGDGTTVATAAGQPSIFVYRSGELLADGTTAVGCRLAFSIFQNAATVFTVDGWALFDAAAAYASGGCPGP